MTDLLKIDRHAAARVAFDAYSTTMAQCGVAAFWDDLDEAAREAWAAAAVAAIAYQAGRELLDRCTIVTVSPAELDRRYLDLGDWTWDDTIGDHRCPSCRGVRLLGSGHATACPHYDRGDG